MKGMMNDEKNDYCERLYTLKAGEISVLSASISREVQNGFEIL